ncbi:MAG: hypothetical protein Q9216_000350 [Gyalolechia sp. 2 TL-2023]
MLSSTSGTTQGLPPQRLSKPRTNTSSSNLLAVTKQTTDPVSPLISSDGDSADGYFTKMPVANGERRPRRNTRSKIRSYFHASNQEEGLSPSSEDEESSPNKLANVARDVRRRLSRTDSSTLQTPSVGASAASSSSRLLIGDIHSSDPDEEQVMQAQIKDKVWTDTLAAQNHVSSPIDEDKHPDSVKSPIRRRSLYTPGIATRSPEDILRKPPPPAQVRSQADREYYYNPSLPDSSPLARLANLRSVQTGRSTPSELDYTHLGALKLGTLRVTNGSASPVPKEQVVIPDPASSLESRSQDEYYTVAEGSKKKATLRSAEELPQNVSSRALERKSLGASAAALPAHIIPCSPVQNSPPEPVMTTDTRPASHRHRSTNTAASSTGHSPHGPWYIKRKPVPSTTPGNEFDHPLCLTIGYSSDILENPSPHQKPAPGPDDGSRDAAFLKLTRNRSSPNVLEDASGRNQEHATKYPLRKGFHATDSGYNSYVSLDSPEKSPTEGQLEVATSAIPYRVQSQSPRVPDGLRKTNPIEESSDSCGTVPHEMSLGTRPLSSFTPRDRTAAANSERDSVATIHPATPPRACPENSRKLQKKRPKSQPPLQRTRMSADNGSSENEIPPVPSSIADLHYKRMSAFPLIDHTYTDFQNDGVDETPSSPVSMAIQTRFPSPAPVLQDPVTKDRSSLFQKLASRARSRSRSRPRVSQPAHESDDESIRSICRSPSWSEYGNAKKKEQRRKEKAERELQKQSEPKPSTEAETTSRSRSRFRSKSRQRSSQHDSIPTLTDLGTVRDSLGTSPYDVAKLRPRLQQHAGGRKVQPHHIGTIKPCRDPSNDVFESEAARSRLRSRSLVAQNEALKEDAQTQKSVASKPDRPCSMYVDRPPIPPLPAVDATPKDHNSQPISFSRIGQAASPSYPHSRYESSDILSNAPAPDPVTPIEELIDRLLDAPDVVSREVILQQIRQHKRGSRGRSSNGCQTTRGGSGEPMKPVESPDPREGAPDRTTTSTCTSARTGLSDWQKIEAEKSVAGDRNLPQSMFADAPPIPPLPTAEYVQQQEERRSTAKSDQKKTLTPPQNQAPGASKKDLWAGCTMQTERRKANGPSSDWDSHRLAWSQRRKSAGEALLSRYRQPEQADIAGMSRHEDIPQEPSRPPEIARAMTTDLEPIPVPSSSRKAFHRPWQTFQSERISGNHTNNNVTATTQAFERLTGRFEGGLSYGYEPGFGLGGSAGTRGTKNGATRKSVQISQGFGVDLSDISFTSPNITAIDSSMQTYRVRAIPRACRPLTTITAPQSARGMGTFFPHFPTQTFAPFFRDLDSLFPSEAFLPRSQQARPFAPRFDVQEVPAAYELHGELPGIKQEDIDIEFVDANTLVIKGKTARESIRTNDVDVKDKGIEGAASPKAVAADNASETSSNYHQPTVEDEYVDAGAEREGSQPTATEGASKSASSEVVAAPATEEQPGHKYWVSERSIGEFQRTFSFPGKVNQEAVKASLKNGILSIIVPKAAKQERKIAIE